jgi:hypothetical protein
MHSATCTHTAGRQVSAALTAVLQLRVALQSLPALASSLRPARTPLLVAVHTTCGSPQLEELLKLINQVCTGVGCSRDGGRRECLGGWACWLMSHSSSTASHWRKSGTPGSWEAVQNSTAHPLLAPTCSCITITTNTCVLGAQYNCAVQPRLLTPCTPIQ